MSRVLVTRQAQEELLAIWAYFAADNPAAADRVLDAIDQRSKRVAGNLAAVMTSMRVRREGM
ncbi:MAG: type II toxin-antitoxin system RelE/ParE family toxin [Chloroflexi bacterium]|nr:type II toxin-antitoxin system RelE/ParE family toxin [Chloroflexota bacterium]